MSEPDHYVYRAYDAAGLLLYIGCTKNPKQRESAHKTRSPWYPHAARIEYEGPYQRYAGYDIERAAIDSEAPFFNSTTSDKAASQANRIECRRRLAMNDIPSEAYFDDDAADADSNAAADEYHVATTRMRRSLADTHPYMDDNDRMARYLAARAELPVSA